MFLNFHLIGELIDRYRPICLYTGTAGAEFDLPLAACSSSCRMDACMAAAIHCTWKFRHDRHLYWCTCRWCMRTIDPVCARVLQVTLPKVTVPHDHGELVCIDNLLVIMILCFFSFPFFCFQTEN